jgi:hypothetical protein
MKTVWIALRYVWITLASVSGAVLGAAAGFFFAYGLGFAAQKANPNDPSAGSAAEVVILTVPCGGVAGAALGAITAVWLTRHSKRARNGEADN